MASQLSITALFRRRSSTKSFRSEVEQELRSSKSQLFDFATLKSATKNFGKVIGQGGFGSVYEGRLAHGQFIAVKQFKIGSGWGVQEFKNAVVLASRLEHKNILKLIGYSITNEAMLTVNDYLPNGSLDKYIFDSTRKGKLDWETRYKIIKGIAHGLLYLHEGLEIRIIHRDLKPRCILLDRDMNPKISGFALAKTLEADQPECSCEFVAGTNGYIAPEGFRTGPCSTKLDIFSFGITILEMITGQGNCRNGLDLYSYVWKHWKEGTSSEVIDSCFVDQCPKEEVLRCIHIGLICAQEKPEERPTIVSVFLMLICNSIKIQDPKAPPDNYNRDIDAEDSDREEGREKRANYRFQ